MARSLVPAIFMDRDGVLIENQSDYVKTWSEVEVYSTALQALADISFSQYKIVVVTNQAAVAKGLTTLDEVNRIHRHLRSDVESAGGRIDAFYVCPHQPEDGCECRKPKPGMLFRASREMDIDLAQSIMIGDALSDLQAGKAAGVKTRILLMSGRGKEQIALPQMETLKPFLVFNDLKQACAVIVTRLNETRI
jgi:D-glycero-D-manno-heptose 1,7-bisphosphate phosphatase